MLKEDLGVFDPHAVLIALKDLFVLSYSAEARFDAGSAFQTRAP
jgi:hypothetical protein